MKTGRLVTVFGGSGFVDRHVVRALAQRGWRIRVVVRRPDLAFHLQLLGNVGQNHAVQANVRYPDSVAHALRDAEVDQSYPFAEGRLARADLSVKIDAVPSLATGR